MATPTELLERESAERFQAILAASPRKFREEVFRRAGIKGKGNTTFSLKSNPKSEERYQKLYEAIQAGLELDDEVSEEIIRNYFFTRRPLLAEALDFLGVAHDQGLTNEDLDFIAELPEEKGTELRALLQRSHDQADVDLYLGYMNINHAA